MSENDKLAVTLLSAVIHALRNMTGSSPANVAVAQAKELHDELKGQSLWPKL